MGAPLRVSALARSATFVCRNTSDAIRLAAVSGWLLSEVSFPMGIRRDRLSFAITNSA